MSGPSVALVQESGSSDSQVRSSVGVQRRIGRASSRENFTTVSHRRTTGGGFAHRQDEESHKETVNRQARPDVDKGQRKGHRVGSWSNQIALAYGPYRFTIGILMEKPAPASRGPPDGIIGQRNQYEAGL